MLNRRVGLLQVTQKDDKRSGSLWPNKMMGSLGDGSVKKGRKIVLITARSEPTQSASNIVLRGFMDDFLAKNSILAEYTRKNVTLMVVPIMSTDGVLLGNSICGVTGQSLKDCLSVECRTVCPELHYLKRLINKLKAEGSQIVASVHLETTRDLHGSFMRTVIDSSFPHAVIKKAMLPSLMHENEPYFDLEKCV